LSVARNVVANVTMAHVCILKHRIDDQFEGLVAGVHDIHYFFSFRMFVAVKYRQFSNCNPTATINI